MGNMQLRQVHEAIEIQEATTETSTDSGDAVRLQTLANAFAFTLDVSAAALAGGDQLDVFVQTQLDGTNWTDVVHFTQVVGDGGAVRYVEKVVAETSLAGFEVASALAAGNVRNIIGDDWRVRWTISGGTAEFTFSVTAQPM